jgi:hypothetical protein
VLDHVQEDVALGGVVHPVHRQQIGDIAFLECDAAQFEAGELGIRRPHGVRRVGAGDLRAFAQAPELGAEDHPARRRPAQRRRRGVRIVRAPVLGHRVRLPLGPPGRTGVEPPSRQDPLCIHRHPPTTGDGGPYTPSGDAERSVEVGRM